MPFSADHPDETDEDDTPSLEDYLRGELQAALDCDSVVAALDIEYLDPEEDDPSDEVDVVHHGSFYRVRRIVVELERVEVDEEEDDPQDERNA